MRKVPSLLISSAVLLSMLNSTSALAGAASAAIAATAVANKANATATTTPATAPAPRGKASKSTWDLAIVGKWKSVDAKNGATHGTITLNKNGTASMQAEKGSYDIVTPLMTGTWETRGSKLHLTMPPYGTSISDYRLNADGILVVTYDNGNPQSFKRQ